MKKSHKIIYWVATIWLALGMLSTAIVQLLQMEKDVANMFNLGYPAYLLTVLGIWKILGVVAVLIPKTPVLKEWAYAGFFFNTSGAIIAHIASGSPAAEIFPAALLTVLTLVSWYFRPASRKMVAAAR